jgi:hypothetical protein
MSVKHVLLKCAIAAAFLILPAISQADSLRMPEGDVILTISGKVQNGTDVEFDRAMLEEMGGDEIDTTTPWYDGMSRFEGVRLDKLLKAVGATGTKVEAIAINDYSSEIPVDDFAEHGVILAYKRNGEYMRIRDKGPLFIIYPFDNDADLKSQKFYARSVWQVKKLVVK